MQPSRKVKVEGKQLKARSSDGVLRVYICGPTVYSDSHMGHARTYVLGDVIRRVLTRFGYRVLFVMNITNIDDKIIARGAEMKLEFKAVADKYETEFLADMRMLNVLPADRMPRVSEYVESIVSFIASLEKNGLAYSVDGVGVYFDVAAFQGRGFEYPAVMHADRKTRTADLSSDEDADVKKRSAADFALWKLAKPGEPKWPSPWGDGRPGWHIECSAMSLDTLGKHVDIHMGGIDLEFPHHTNETAQSQAFIGEKLWVTQWMHFGHLNINGLKMSKSLKNFTTIRSALQAYTAAEIRLFFLLQTQWSHTQDLTTLAMLEARDYAYFVADSLFIFENAMQDETYSDAIETKMRKLLTKTTENIDNALVSNFNFVTVLKELKQLLTTTRGYVQSGRTALHPLLMHDIVAYTRNLLENTLGIDLKASHPLSLPLFAADRALIARILQLRQDVRIASKSTNIDLNTLAQSVRSSLSTEVHPSHSSEPLAFVLRDFYASINQLKEHKSDSKAVVNGLQRVGDEIRAKLGAVGVNVQDIRQESSWELHSHSTTQEKTLQDELRKLRAEVAESKKP